MTAVDDYPDLVRLAVAGDETAMETLLMRAQDVAYRFGMTVCGHQEDAEDVMQDALMRTYQRATSIREPQAFRAWLYRTVRNACLMKRRTRVDEPRHMVSLDAGFEGDGSHPIDTADPSRGPEEVVLNNRLRQRLKEALGSLPPAYRAVVFLREVEGLSTREVATVLRISEANVKQRLHRARLALQQVLGAGR